MEDVVEKSASIEKRHSSMSLEAAIARRYPFPGKAGEAIRERTLRLCRDHITSGLADRNCEQRLCSEEHTVYWQQFSEVLLAYQLQACGLKLSHAAEGPDFLVEHGGQRIWIEVISRSCIYRCEGLLAGRLVAMEALRPFGGNGCFSRRDGMEKFATRCISTVRCRFSAGVFGGDVTLNLDLQAAIIEQLFERSPGNPLPAIVCTVGNVDRSIHCEFVVGRWT
ncbi:hypothetical protein ACCT28_36775 [Rhizobium ruizarguesonis]